MKHLKRIFCAVLAVCLILAMCACGGSNSSSTDASNDSSSSSAAPDAVSSQGDASTGEEVPEDDGTVTYTVTVVDVEGNPVSGAMIQICKDACVPASTDENGVATWKQVEDDYKVSFLMAPEGYAVEEAYYFEAGSYELTITLQAAE